MRSIAHQWGDRKIFISFMSADIEIGPNVLAPRAETEILGRTALDLLRDIPEPLVVDMCCGSGNVGLGILAGNPGIRLFGADVSEDAVGWARRNAARLDGTGRVIFEQGDMFAALAAHELKGRVDLIACNPPYISSHKLENESAHLLDNEPRVAFDAGPYGIAIHQRLIAEAPDYLKTGGWLVFEFGIGQDRQVKALLARSKRFAAPIFSTDDDGVPRVAAVQRL